jgi:hypothetical protein
MIMQTVTEWRSMPDQALLMTLGPRRIIVHAFEVNRRQLEDLYRAIDKAIELLDAGKYEAPEDKALPQEREGGE